MGGQLQPQEIAALRPCDPGVGGEVIRNQAQSQRLLSRQCQTQLPQVALIAPALQKI